MLVWLLLRKTGGAEMTTTISVTVTCHFSFKVEFESYRNRYTRRCYKLNSLYLDLCCIFGGLISNFHAPRPISNFHAPPASSEAQEQYSSEDDNGDLPTTEINTEKKQDDFGISKQIKGC